MLQRGVAIHCQVLVVDRAARLVQRGANAEACIIVEAQDLRLDEGDEELDVGLVALEVSDVAGLAAGVAGRGVALSTTISLPS